MNTKIQRVVSLIIVLALCFSFLSSVLTPRIVEANPGWDFTINLLTSDKLYYNGGEEAQIWVKFTNTGSETISLVKADFEVISPQGQIVFTGSSWDGYPIAPGVYWILDTHWTIPVSEPTGYYSIEVTITVYETSLQGPTVVKTDEVDNYFWVAGGPPNPAPILSVSPTSLDFGTSETQKSLSIANNDGGTLTWSISSNKAWLTVNPTSGQGNANIVVNVNRNGLSSGDTGIIMVTSNGGSQTVSVTVSVLLAQPDLKIITPLQFPNDIPAPFEPNVIKIKAWVTNVGSTTAQDIQVSFKINGVPIGGSPIDIGTIASGGPSKSAEILWRANSNVEDATLEVEAQSIGQGDINPSDNIVTQPVSFYFVDSRYDPPGFQHDRDAFCFPNWQYSSRQKEFWQDMYNFLVKQGLDEDGFTLIGTPLVSSIVSLWGQSPYCYGMAATSATYYVYPMLKPVNKATFAMTEDEAKPDIINRQWSQILYAYPFLFPLIKGLTAYSASAEYDKILDYIKDKDQPILLSLIAPAPHHAILAYKVLDLGEDEKRVYVYENNRPYDDPTDNYSPNPAQTKDEDYYVTFSPNSNTASYTLIGSPTYYWDRICAFPIAETMTLDDIEESLKFIITSRLKELYDNILTAFHIHSPVMPLLIDEYGRRIGYVGTTFVNEIPGAEMVEELDSHVLYLPSNLTYSVELTGNDTGTLGLDLEIPTGNETLRVVKWEGIPVTLGSVSTMTLNATGTNYGVTLSTGEVVKPETMGEINVSNIFPSSGGGCFIATAAYGTPLASEIQILREFRDEYLLTNPLGQAFVNLYYKVSPPIAEFITEHPSLKPIVRTGLVPAVAMSTVIVNTTSAEKMIIMGLLVLVSVAVAVWAMRRRKRGPA
jgi:hypothetical protein